MTNPSFELGASGWRLIADGGLRFPVSGYSSTSGCADGRFCVVSSQGATGRVASSAFTVTQRWLCWYAGGSASFVGVDVAPFDGNPDAQVSMPATDRWKRACMDLESYVGQQAQVILGDDVSSLAANAWGMWDGLSCEDADRSAESR